VANAVSPGATGSYTLSLQSGGGGGGASDGGGSSGDAGGGGSIEELGRTTLPRITAGQSVSGRLASGDFVLSADDTFADGYLYDGRAGERITITLRSAAFDAWLVFDDPNGPLRETNDDGAGGNDAQLIVTLPHAGRYLIVANSLQGRATGAYTLTVRSGGSGGASAGGAASSGIKH
jgi:hypothetical protein